MRLDPAVMFLLVLLIGVAAGLIFDRVAGPGWFARQVAGTRGMVTSATLSRGERVATNFDAAFIVGRVTLARSDSFSIIRMIVRPASPT